MVCVLCEPAIVSTAERQTFAKQIAGAGDAATALSVMYGIVRTPLTPLQRAGPAAAISRINAATINNNCTKRLRCKVRCTFRTRS